MRMSREFNLVLLGAGLLTAGYFLWPSDDIRAGEQAADAGGKDNGNGSRRGRTTAFFFISSRSYTSTRTATASTVSRGGFGGVGRGFSFGG